MINLLSDKNIPLSRDQLPDAVELTLYDPVGGIPENVDEYDALFVRTVSPIDKTTIPENPVNLKFIGSATAGFDHVDKRWLDEQNIVFACSPGCNANAVGEYVTVALMIWALESNMDLAASTVGIIGAGNTGRAVAEKLSQMEVPYQYYDPPRASQDPSFDGVSMEEILDCDILTFHTPLTFEGNWPTYHWLNSAVLGMSGFKLILNAARGGIIDEEALFSSWNNRKVESYILDVWENEPLFSDRIANNAFIKTPHIAGYSVQAKRRATEMALNALCTFFDLPVSEGRETDPSVLPVVKKTDIQPDLLHMLYKLNPICEYSRRFTSLIGQAPEKKTREFQNLRTDFPLRHEHPRYQLDPAVLQKFPELGPLGFHLSPEASQ